MHGARARRPRSPPTEATLRTRAELPIHVLPLCLAALALASCGETRPRVVLWIEVDTLRADALGCYGNASVGEDGALPSPAIDAVARESVVFERAYSAAPWTIPSLVTQLSGVWPFEHRHTRLLERVPPEDLPLVPRLAAAGWRTAGVTTNFVATSRTGFDAGFERFDDALATGHEGSSAEQAVDRLLAFLDELDDAPGSGVFLFALLFEPHFRYEAHEGLRFGPGFGDAAGAPYAGPLDGTEEMNDLLRRRAELAPGDVAFLRGRYASEVAAVDRAIGRLAREFRRRGLWDDAAVVLVADHGEELLERGWLGHSVTLHDELVRVPLVVRLPGGEQAGRRIAHPVSLIDLPATVLELATGERLDPDHDAGVHALGESRSLVPTIVDGVPPQRRFLYLHTDFEPPLPDPTGEKSAHRFGVVDARERIKWSLDLAGGGEPRAELFDLDADPGERESLAAKPDARAGEALVRLRARMPR